MKTDVLVLVASVAAGFFAVGSVLKDFAWPPDVAAVLTSVLWGCLTIVVLADYWYQEP